MLYCKIFYMEQFHALRKAAGCEYSYIQSLARCMKWDTTGGKSGSSFLKTRDDRFIMKQLSKIELEAFIKFAPHYFRYMQEAFYHKVRLIFLPHLASLLKLDSCLFYFANEDFLILCLMY